MGVIERHNPNESDEPRHDADSTDDRSDDTGGHEGLARRKHCAPRLGWKPSAAARREMEN